MATLPLPLKEFLISQWHPTKNYPLSQSDVSHGSCKIVWWQCDRGHEWQASPNARSSNSKNANGCPVCANQRVLKGYNDLETLYPKIADEWHSTLNGNLLPSDVMSKTHKKVWWRGHKCHHVWEAAIANRVSANTGCPFCAGKRVLLGYNDLATQYPALAEEWHPTKNDMNPYESTSGSHKVVWWICEYKHEWEAPVRHRVQGFNCPICGKQRRIDAKRERVIIKREKAITKRREATAKRKYTPRMQVIKGFNDLASQNPSFSLLWHPTKNGDLTPETIFTYSSQRLWWQCTLGHEWQRSINDKRKKKNDCPFCKNKRILVGYNDLATTHPALIHQWHPTKNGSLLPTDISYGSSKKIWWVCNKGHEWRVAANNRVSYNTECPDCAVHIFVSRAEQEIATILLSHGLHIVQSDRRTVKNQELDIYIPEKKIAVEYNGVYWHSEKAGRDRKYHYDKWLAAKNVGIQLIQIWEDEWKRNPEQVKAMLLHKLGINNQGKIFARKTTFSILRKSEVESFLNRNHVQGFDNGSLYLGLTEGDTNELVAVMVLKKMANNTLNIVRYATSKRVVGGFTKLLKNAELILEPSRFIAYSDNCVSDGSLYASNGFGADKEIAPDYRYVVKDERKNKSGYRLKRFREDPNLQWQDGLTEKQLAELNNIHRIWDAGKTRWVKILR